MRSNHIQKMTAAGLLIAIGIVVPIYAPKIVIGPASMTLASHVAIFIAMMISPGVAVAVAICTTLGFFLNPVFGPIIVARAASHLVFALVGSYYLQSRPHTLQAPVRIHLFSLLIACIHAVCEVVAVLPFYFAGQLADYSNGFIHTVLVMVGGVTVLHSLLDFEISLAVFKVLGKQKSFAALTQKG